MSGLTYKGIHSNTYNLIVKSVNRQLFPDVKTYTQSVPGLDGVIDYGGDTYGCKQIAVLLQYNYNHNMSNLMAQSEKIGAWLYNDGSYHDLIFDDQPTRVYKAKMATKVDNLPGSGLSITFVCNPPWPYVNGVPLTPSEILWDTASIENNQYFQEFAASGVMRFSNSGTFAVKPIIKLIGYIPSGTMLTYGTSKWQYVSPLTYDSIIIDCVNETVTRGSDGVSLYGQVSTTHNAYFKFSPGQIEISVQATGLSAWPNSLTIAAEFMPQEVV